MRKACTFIQLEKLPSLPRSRSRALATKFQPLETIMILVDESDAYIGTFERGEMHSKYAIRLLY
jgi:hypothetical protein